MEALKRSIKLSVFFWRRLPHSFMKPSLYLQGLKLEAQGVLALVFGIASRITHKGALQTESPF
jgi:hypothetical protein